MPVEQFGEINEGDQQEITGDDAETDDGETPAEELPQAIPP